MDQYMPVNTVLADEIEKQQEEADEHLLALLRIFAERPELVRLAQAMQSQMGK